MSSNNDQMPSSPSLSDEYPLRSTISICSTSSMQSFMCNDGGIDTTRRIPNFLSCKKCFKTYKYSRVSGTSQFNNHLCAKVAMVLDTSTTTSDSLLQTTAELSSPSPIRSNLKQQTLTNTFTTSRKLLSQEI
ncbi:unnamed protein product [Rotaria sp. Silwood2]|nr:unnamed protein product [Rotaria sp. Silwood2]CAF2908974.1 unnamed protein product [Rotaria sp. Silwood2]CAF3947567.1 unnamed protein product [Rotaria sp. Silwood2]CAF4227952.1 unnamed protein product [Rotaria sp. Silwood2]